MKNFPFAFDSSRFDSSSRLAAADGIACSAWAHSTRDTTMFNDDGRFWVCVCVRDVQKARFRRSRRRREKNDNNYRSKNGPRMGHSYVEAKPIYNDDVRCTSSVREHPSHRSYKCLLIIIFIIIILIAFAPSFRFVSVALVIDTLQSGERVIRKPFFSLPLFPSSTTQDEYVSWVHASIISTKRRCNK